jgi:hypothetical protein
MAESCPLAGLTSAPSVEDRYEGLSSLCSPPASNFFSRISERVERQVRPTGRQSVAGDDGKQAPVLWFLPPDEPAMDNPAATAGANSSSRASNRVRRVSPTFESSSTAHPWLMTSTHDC